MGSDSPGTTAQYYRTEISLTEKVDFVTFLVYIKKFVLFVS